MEITLDGNRIGSLKDVYKQLEPILLRGECPWGDNLDSLQDVVDMQFNYTGNSALDISRITWLSSDKSKDVLGITETLKWLKAKIEKSTSQEHHKHIENLMEEVEAGQSKTLFDNLVEILSSNSSIKFNQL